MEGNLAKFFFPMQGFSGNKRGSTKWTPAPAFSLLVNSLSVATLRAKANAAPGRLTGNRPINDRDGSGAARDFLHGSSEPAGLL